MEVFIVYAVLSDGMRHALAAYAKREDAERHRSRCTAHSYDESGYTLMSPAEVLGLSAVVVERLEVQP